MAIGYTPQTWANGTAPALSAANLQTMDNGINSACDALDTPATMAPIVATAIEAGTATATPADTDKLGGAKADHSLLYYTWANIKAAIKAYADTLYSDLAHQARHRIGGADALPAASDTVSGLVELATAAEVATGTDTGRTPSVATLKASLAETNAWLTKRTKMPDGATAVYSQDAFATADSWARNSGSGTVAVSNGRLTVEAACNGVYRSIVGCAGKVMLVKIAAAAAGNFSFALGGSAGATISLPASSVDGIYAIQLPAYAASNFVGISVTGVAFSIDWLWIGDYSYLTGTLSEEAARIANQLGDTAGVGVAASGTITSNGTNVSDGDYFEVGGKRYTWRAALTASPGVEGEVLIGAAYTASLEDAKLAVTRDEGAGTNNGVKYWAAARHPLVTATRDSATLTLTARSTGEQGNSITLAKSAATLTLSGSTLSGGYSDAAAKIITATQNNIAGSGTRPAAARLDIASTSLVGYEQAVDVAAGGTTTLPAGGTWIWFCYGYGATISSAKRGSSAGGATLTVAGANATVWYRKYS